MTTGSLEADLTALSVALLLVLRIVLAIGYLWRGRSDEQGAQLPSQRRPTRAAAPSESTPDSEALEPTP